MKPIKTYVENGLTIVVYPEKQIKRKLWQKNDTFYSAKMRVEDGMGGLFTPMTRKAGKA